jgi:hypothetical protein
MPPVRAEAGKNIKNVAVEISDRNAMVMVDLNG